MHSPQVAGTGVLHQSDAEENDLDLAAVDEILSQHSTHTPSTHPVPQPAPSPHSRALARQPGFDAKDRNPTLHSHEQRAGPGVSTPSTQEPVASPVPEGPAAVQAHTASAMIQGPRAKSVATPKSQDTEAMHITVQEFDAGRFSLLSGFSQPLVTLYKQVVPRPFWHTTKKLWVFRDEAYQDLMQKLHQAEFPVNVISLEGDAPGSSTKDFTSALKVLPPPACPDAEVSALVQQHLPKALFGRLYPFQQQGVRFGVQHHGRVLLADEMGLGKTVQAIGIAACYPEEWPLLVICPSSMRLVWYDALLNWLPAHVVPEPTRDIVVVGNGKDIRRLSGTPPKNHVVIVSYDMVQKLQDYIKHFGIIICDESHALKSHGTKRTKFLWPVIQKVKRAVLITGTPALSRPIELYPQIDMLVPGILGSRDDFGKRYCGGKKQPIARGAWDWKGSSNLAELNAVLQSHLLIRRLKKDVLQDLPAKQRQRVPIEVDPEHIKTLEGIKVEMAAVQRKPLPEDLKRAMAEKLVNSLYAASGPAKLKSVVEQVQHALEEGGKVIVFAHHIAVLDGIQTKLGTAFNTVRIDGSTNMANRKQAMDDFQQKPHVKLAILSISAAGVGITLTAAQTVVFAELYWNPGHLIQAEDRAHRLGQQGCVQVRYLIAPGTIDDAMWPLLGRKLQVVGRALDGNATGSATGLQITDASGFAQYMPAASESAAAQGMADQLQQTAQLPQESTPAQPGPLPCGQTPIQSGLAAIGQRPSAARGSIDRGLCPAGPSEAVQSGGNPIPDGGNHSRQGTLDLRRFSMQSGSKRKADATHGDDASDNMHSFSGRKANCGVGDEQTIEAVTHAGQNETGSAAQHAKRRLSAAANTDQLLDLTQDDEAAPMSEANASKDCTPAVLTESSRKKRRSMLLRTSARNVVDLT